MAKPRRKTDTATASFFEEDYLVRTLGRIAHDPEVALTELVANAWDAGASLVDLTIPPSRELALTVEDDGHGMSAVQFKGRWMRLGYDRIKHQGPNVEFQPGARIGAVGPMAATVLADMGCCASRVSIRWRLGAMEKARASRSEPKARRPHSASRRRPLSCAKGTALNYRLWLSVTYLIQTRFAKYCPHGSYTTHSLWCASTASQCRWPIRPD